jgi:hypothetical protein
MCLYANSLQRPKWKRKHDLLLPARRWQKHDSWASDSSRSKQLASRAPLLGSGPLSDPRRAREPLARAGPA